MATDDRSTDCKNLTRMFKEKFGRYPDIRYMDTNGYGMQYCLFKESIATVGVIPFYMMGDNLKFAEWYIGNLKVIPSSIVTFDTLEQRNEWRKQEAISKYQKEMNALFEDKFDDGLMTGKA